MKSSSSSSSRNSIVLIAVALSCIVLLAIFTSSSSHQSSSSQSDESETKKPSSSTSTNNVDDEKPHHQNTETPKKSKIGEDENNGNAKNDDFLPAIIKKTGKKKRPSFLGVPDSVAVPDTEDNGCDNVVPDMPLSPLEEELRRLLFMAIDVLNEKKLVGWPADATLLGLVREGRVATDRDIDFQVHSTYAWCADHLHSLKEAFEKRAKIRMFKVVYGKYKGRKIGRYAMVRMPPKYGDFGTGIDFNCVYTDDTDGAYTMHVHKGTIEPIPKVAFPLKFCLGYGRPIPCPQDPMAVLGMFKPRYDGCMVFPHCTGDPSKHGVSRKCLTPHLPMPKQKFVDTMKKLEQCGWVSLAKHYDEEPACEQLLKLGDSNNVCEPMKGAKYPVCFLQNFVG